MSATLFVSDLHLAAERPDKTAAFIDLLGAAGGRVQALYVLGDLFEIWLGDDDATAPHPEVIAAMRALSDAGTALYVMRGNRDFLFGEDFAAASGAVLLPDHHVISLAGASTLLMHGDLLCTLDVKYQEFRRYVRDPGNQAAFLGQPLAQRRAIAAQTRAGTQASMLEKDDFIMDVEQATVDATMREHGVHRLLHGHTHRPAVHRFELDGAPAERYVLGDWYDEDIMLWADEGTLSLMPAADCRARLAA